jgi:ribose transport system ATP-binding protein
MIEMGCNLLGNMLSSSFITTRDIFIEESNHRLKNNLQTIISLLFIKKQLCHFNGIPSENALEEMDAFIESMVSRIKLIADMHDFISKRRTDISEVSTEEILQTIADSYKGCDVQIIIDTEYLLLPYETASVVIMILNELVCNSFKHAFKLKEDDSENIIRIGFKEENDEIVMFVRDNGCGIANAQSLADLQKSNSLGMTIVNSLVIKLRASIEFVNDNGMNVTVRFRC